MPGGGHWRCGQQLRSGQKAGGQVNRCRHVEWRDASRTATTPPNCSACARGLTSTLGNSGWGTLQQP